MTEVMPEVVAEVAPATISEVIASSVHPMPEVAPSCSRPAPKYRPAFAPAIIEVLTEVMPEDIANAPQTPFLARLPPTQDHHTTHAPKHAQNAKQEQNRIGAERTHQPTGKKKPPHLERS